MNTSYDKSRLTFPLKVGMNFVGFVNTAHPAPRLENPEFYQYIDNEMLAINDIIAKNLSYVSHRLRYCIYINPLKVSFAILVIGIVVYILTKLKGALYFLLMSMLLFAFGCCVACVGQYKQVAYIYPIKDVLEGPVRDYISDKPVIKLFVLDTTTNTYDNDGGAWIHWSMTAEIKFNPEEYSRDSCSPLHHNVP